MEGLGDDIERIRELGISYGLSDQAIDECLLRAVGHQTTFSTTPTSINKRRQKRKPSKFRKLCMVFLMPFLLMIALYIVGSFHQPTGQFIGKHLANASYPFFRYVRLVTLPVARNLDLTGECLSIYIFSWYDKPFIKSWDNQLDYKV